MPTLQTYQLSARAGGTLAPHFGRLGIGIEEATPTWPSDSLFAALIAQAALLGEPGAQFIAAMTGDNPPLRHSSLFPRIGPLVLLPRPALPLTFVSDEQRETIGKGFKKVRFLSPKLFKAVCAGVEDLSHFNHLTLQGGQVWISADEAEGLPDAWKVRHGDSDGRRAQVAATPIWAYQSEPHVTVDRASSASAYYEAGRVFFAPDCGLALLTTKRDSFFERLLEQLGEGGIGGRRSVGNGAFSCAHTGELTFDAGGDRVVTLSRFLPRDAAEIEIIQHKASRYQLVEAGGWATTSESASFRRKEVTMLAEGAVLAKRVRGHVVDVRSGSFEPRPSHEVWRSGLALTVPIGAKEDNHAA